MVEPNSMLTSAQQEALDNHVILLCPSISWWRGQYQIPSDKIETKTDGTAIDEDDITAPRAKLMTDRCPVDHEGRAWKKRFQAIEGQLNAIKQRYSVPFPITGVRIVPKDRGKAMFDELYGLTYGQLEDALNGINTKTLPVSMTYGQMQSAKTIAHNEFGEALLPSTSIYNTALDSKAQSVAYELEKNKREFCQNWEDIRRQIATTNKVFSLVASRVPTSGTSMATKFCLDVVPIEIAGSQSTALTTESLRAHHDVVREVCQRRVSQAIEEMIAEPRDQLAKALASLQELIARDGRVTSKSFAPVRAAIEKIRMFDFVANETLLAQITQLENCIDSTSPRDLTSAHAAQSGFTAAITSFMDEVTDANKRHADAQKFGRPLRAIRMAPVEETPVGV